MRLKFKRMLKCQLTKANIKSIRPNEIMWLGQVLMLKATEEKVILQYTIISENTNGDLTGEIEVNN